MHAQKYRRMEHCGYSSGRLSSQLWQMEIDINALCQTGECMA